MFDPNATLDDAALPGSSCPVRPFPTLTFIGRQPPPEGRRGANFALPFVDRRGAFLKVGWRPPNGHWGERRRGPISAVG